MRHIISRNVSKLTGRSQTRKSSIALQPNSRNSAPSLLTYSRFENQIWRFWFYQILRRCNNENIIWQTFCSFSPTDRLAYICCAWRWGGAWRAEAENMQQKQAGRKPEPGAVVATAWLSRRGLWDWSVRQAWFVCFSGVTEVSSPSLFLVLYFCADKFAFCATMAFRVLFWFLIWTGWAVVGTRKRR